MEDSSDFIDDTAENVNQEKPLVYYLNVEDQNDMIIRSHELYKYVVRAFDNKKCQECGIEDIKFRIIDNGMFVCRNCDKKYGMQIASVDEIRNTFEELTQEIRVMIFKRQLYLKHIRNTKDKTKSMENLAIDNDLFDNNDKNSYLGELYREYKKYEALLKCDPEENIICKKNEIERIHKKLTYLKNLILEYDCKLFEISKEAEYEHCSMIKKSINENKEDYIYINLGKGKSESIFDEDSKLSLPILYRLQGSIEALSSRAFLINEEETQILKECGDNLRLLMKAQEKFKWNKLTSNTESIKRFMKIHLKPKLSESDKIKIFNGKCLIYSVENKSIKLNLEHCNIKENSEEITDSSLSQISSEVNLMLMVLSKYSISNLTGLSVLNCGASIQKVHKICNNMCLDLPTGSLLLDCGESYRIKIAPLIFKSISSFVECSALTEFYFTNFKLYGGQLSGLINACKFVETVEIYDNEVLDKEKIRLTQISYCESYENETKVKPKVTFNKLILRNNKLEKTQFKQFIMDLIGPCKDYFKNLVKIDISQNFDEKFEEIAKKKIFDAFKMYQKATGSRRSLIFN